MVYRGKPSAGCGACRSRKVKVRVLSPKGLALAHLGNQCDQARPACGRCIKAKRACPGYRDQLSLLFRDESQSVAQKAKLNSAKVSSSNFPAQETTSKSFRDTLGLVTPTHGVDSLTPSTTREITPREDDWDEVELQLPLYCLKESERHHAACFFFTSYSWLYSGLMQGRDFRGELSPSAPTGEKAMMNAMVSSGMASISSLQGSQSMRMSAFREYSKTLKWINAAISDRKQATEDTTLAAILCLSLFEVLTCQSPESFKGFVGHTKGAVALLDLRGEKQLRTDNAVMLFYSLRNQIIAACLLSDIAVPAGLLVLSEKASILLKPSISNVVGHQLTILMAKLCDLRVMFVKTSPNVDADFLSKAFTLDAELEAFANEFSAYLTYDIVVTSPGKSFKVAESHELPRIMLNEMILDQLNEMVAHPGAGPPSPDFKNLCRRVCGVVRKLARNICESVPSVLTLGRLRNGRNRCQMEGLGLLYPLYLAGAVDGPRSPTGEWVRNCLTVFGVSLGIDQALTQARMLEHETVLTRVLDHLQEDDDDHVQAPIDAEMQYDFTAYNTQYS
ncbi:hypothetical protein PISL3812_06472 [Talaromyces islandicus]|uniref:Zn(2)-C6 fungal-type domain-containing protein n=1 Tax=Talaromyces islandicus TaxID=28573 RepID=A0A0U1M318_TALIS|nr:hypothetical protein PISL3812_06472 [Talaromyces islandicus]